MITDAHGRPVATEGNDTRKISIVETNHNGKMVWAIDYHPNIAVFEFEEVFQILGNAIMGIATNARQRKHEAMINRKIKTEIEKLKE